MATVTILFARTLAGAAGYTLTEDGALVAGGRVVHRVRPPGGGRLAEADYFALIDWLRRNAGDDAGLVLRYAATLPFDELGVLGLAFKTAPTLRESLSRIERYFHLVTDSVAYRLDEAGEPAVFAIESRTDPNPAHAFRNECALATFARNMARFVGPALALDHVAFSHPRGGDPARYEAHFGCPVRFGAGGDGIALARGMLDLPNQLGDRAVSDFLTRHLEQEIGALSAADTLEVELRRHLSRQLSTGVPGAAETAKALGMSERTLYRRLSEEGLTYQGVVREVQRSLAEELLAGDTCSIAEVAFLTGFAEQSTFSRAFKRWVGRPPASYRREARPA